NSNAKTANGTSASSVRSLPSRRCATRRTKQPVGPLSHAGRAPRGREASRAMNSPSKAVVLAAARTPFGRLGGGLSPLEATTLGAAAVVAAVERSDIDPSEIEHVIMGQVLQAGAG